MSLLSQTPAIHKTRPTNANDVGTVPATVSAKVEEFGGPGHTRITRLTFVDHVVTMTDATTSGCHGAFKFYDLPQGSVLIQGYNVNLTTLAGSGGITDTAAVVLSVGTVTAGTDNATLLSTEADVVPSTVGTLAAGAGTFAATSVSAYVALTDSSGGATSDSTLASIAATPTQAQVANAIAQLNNRINFLADRINLRQRLVGSATTAADLFLNIAVPDAGSTANDTITLNGVLEFHWVNLGSNGTGTV
jgi:hypothetical protein